MAMQGPLLANYSHSFIEQLRSASLPYANSTAGAKRQLPFEDKSRLQRFWVWLKLTVKKQMPWGEAAAQRKQKLWVTLYPTMIFLGQQPQAASEYRGSRYDASQHSLFFVSFLKILLGNDRLPMGITSVLTDRSQVGPMRCVLLRVCCKQRRCWHKFPFPCYDCCPVLLYSANFI